ncbi:MAG TPA: Spy/CpxP family protein refolding chaperone [Thermodesulfovibrionales bacterium]|nr:Spy/CpxP family protein refolding chaperone [Thermodesulfovibrionales bacterium]
MKDIFLILLSVIVIAQLIVSLVSRIRQKHIRGYLDLITLTKEQKRQVEEIRRDFLPKVEGIRQSLRLNRLQLNDLLFAEEPDMKTIGEKSGEISALQAELEREVIGHILQEKELLSPEQKRQFCEVIRGEFDKGGLGVHGERRPGPTRNAGK